MASAAERTGQDESQTRRRDDETQTTRRREPDETSNPSVLCAPFQPLAASRMHPVPSSQLGVMMFQPMRAMPAG